MEPLGCDTRSMMLAELSALRAGDHEHVSDGERTYHPQFFLSVRRISFVLFVFLISITVVFLVIEVPATLFLFFIWGVVVEAYDRMVKNQHTKADKV